MVQTAPRVLEARRFELPRIGPDEGLLRVEACGICGSDCEQFEGVLPVELPVVPGHEPLGFIEEIGDEAAKRWGVRKGDRVVVEAILSCGGCRLCRSGRRHLCQADGKRFCAYAYMPVSESPSLWGAYAEFMYLDPRSVLHKIDPSVPAETAVMYNPLGAGFRWAGEIGGVQEGDTVVIMGPGQRGLACVIAAREAGAEHIIVSGLSSDARKLELAESYGATHTFDVDEHHLVDEVAEITGHRGADVVIDVSSYAVAPVAQSLSLAGRGGTVVLAGVKGMKEVPAFVSDLAVYKELTIHGALGVTSSAFRAAIDLIEAGSVNLEAMHTHNFPLSQAELAIRTLAGEIEGEEAIHCCLINSESPPHPVEDT